MVSETLLVPTSERTLSFIAVDLIDARASFVPIASSDFSTSALPSGIACAAVAGDDEACACIGVA